MASRVCALGIAACVCTTFNFCVCGVRSSRRGSLCLFDYSNLFSFRLGKLKV